MPQQITIKRAEDLDAESPAAAPAGDSAPDKPKRKSSRLRTGILFTVLIALVGVMCGFTTNFIPSNSMEPTLNPGDHILTMRRWLAYPFGSDPRPGDIIVFKLQTSRVTNADNALGIPTDDDSSDPKMQILIKRVIAVGGDKIKIKANQVFVNDKELHESHPITPVQDTDAAVYVYADGEDYRIQKGKLFVLGDNRDTSEDSRFWGPLDTKDVVGRFVRVLYNEGKNGPNEHRDPEQSSAK